MNIRHLLLLLVPACLNLVTLAPMLHADTTLWRIGREDGSRAEFTSTTNAATFTIPADWATRASWPEFAGKTYGSWKSPTWGFDTTVTYTLGSGVPANGVELQIQTIDAGMFVPELAVFANGFPCGIIQMVGRLYFWEEANSTGQRLGNRFRVYIPKEFLKAGANTIRLKKLDHPYASDTASRMDALSDNYAYLAFTFDYIRLVSLSEPAAEPVHGRFTSLGMHGTFDMTLDNATYEPMRWKWLGFAYSGNIHRVGFWSDLTSRQPNRMEYLAQTKAFNMRVLMDFLSRSKDTWVDGAGELIASKKSDLSTFFGQYGPHFHYYELNNEPTMQFSDESFAATKAIARYLNTIKPDHIKITAPGYNYGFQNFGSPGGWDRNASYRAELEQLCQATNGHSYGDGYRSESLPRTLDVYGPALTSGFPKEFVNSEFGAGDGPQTEFSDQHIDPTAHGQSKFDRITRAHVAMGDKSCFYIGTDHSGKFLVVDGQLNQPATWLAHPDPNWPNNVPRLTILRQLVLAYSTHGAPLKYEYTSPVSDKLIYTRCVDTSKLAPLPGSGATSDKVLLNFVNFDRVTQSFSVRVTLPVSGTYVGECYGPETSYLEAKSDVSFVANPTADVSVTLGPRESVQYILTIPKDGAASGLTAEYFNNKTLTGAAALTRYEGVNFAWSGSPAPGINGDRFSVRWSGAVEAPVTGRYTFTVVSDDGVRLDFNGVRVVDDWRDHAAKTYTYSVDLTQGQKYPIRFEFYDNAGRAEARLQWAYPGQTNTPVPVERLTPAFQGLRADYFNNKTVSGTPVLTRYEAVNFGSGATFPGEGVNPNNFSARWSGFVEAPATGTYVFTATGDDGVRLFFNNQQVIDAWRDQGPTSYTWSVSLTQGQRYPIRLDYYENIGLQQATLEWSYNGQPKTIIPSGRLFP